ncbi:uncharacterized protein CEXT_265881 [Caerostris extrusa]|uniref:Uncharacterized protein n=1 Tax=Caerostris extrusa TaxID=172846 RepID=A0AAV4WIP7_CAEEX|nr:uncharacterized protein CEXT_265881 [Caerostris extrusa]
MDVNDFLGFYHAMSVTQASEAKNTTSDFIEENVDPFFNKYTLIGGLVLLSGLLIASIFYYFLKHNFCCHDDYSRNLYSVVSDDARSFTEDSDDDPIDLFESCRLCVHDHEVNTATNEFEYDCRSTDVSLSEEEKLLFMQEKRRRHEAFHCPEPSIIHTVS